MSGSVALPSRLAEIAANLAAVRTRIADACAVSGRDPTDVTIIAVTKTFPASDVRLLAELGMTDVGENRDQEAAPKHAECADLPLRWHFVGQLQRNKCRSVATYADVVHSVDRLPLVDALSAAAVAAGRELDVLLQVSLDLEGAAGRAGATPVELPALAAAVTDAPALTLTGLMAVAPLAADPDEPFARLAEVAAGLRRTHPEATVLSAGMSGDLEAAIGHGATHVRIGTALLGHRPPPVG